MARARRVCSQTTAAATFRFLRPEAVTASPSANGSFYTGTNEGNLIQQHSHGNSRGRRLGNLEPDVLEPFVVIKGHCANFSQASHY